MTCWRSAERTTSFPMALLVLAAAASLTWAPASVAQPAADLDRFLEDNPRIAAAMVWLGVDNAPRSYTEWPRTLRDKLAAAVRRELRGEGSGLPEVMPNRNSDRLGDADWPETILSREDAEDLYVAHIANQLVLEMTGALPWSLGDLSEYELSLLFAWRVGYANPLVQGARSGGFYREYDGGGFGGVTGYSVYGRVLPAPPDVVRDFLDREDLVGDTRYETIVRTIEWARFHLSHFSGRHRAGNAEDHWGYRGHPPLARILAGTTYGEGTVDDRRHWTAGCHGTSWFLHHLLRAVNIPVGYIHWGEHGMPSFPSEALYLSHGDDPYSRLTQYWPPFPEPFPASEILVAEATFRKWFNERHSHRENDNNVGRRPTELAVEHLPPWLLQLRCSDRAAGRTNESSEVYRPGSAGIGRYWTVAELEAMRFWERMDARIERYGGCPIPGPGERDDDGNDDEGDDNDDDSDDDGDDPPPPAGTCVADGETVCLQDSRYSVSVEWFTADGSGGSGRVVRDGTDDSGMFQFFDANNWEVLIKVLDGCSVNGHMWVFGASTTDLGYVIRVTDTATGAVREYRNEPGTPAPAITDTTAFPEGVC